MFKRLSSAANAPTKSTRRTANARRTVAARRSKRLFWSLAFALGFASWSVSSLAAPPSDDETQTTRFPVLELGDVEEFSAEARDASRLFNEFSSDETTTRKSLENPAILAVDDVDSDEIAATSALVADECFYALDPYSSLFIDYPPTAAWTETALISVETILADLATAPRKASAEIKKFRRSIADAERLKDAIAADAAKPNADSDDDAERPEILRYSPEERAELFESFRSALDRRAFVWTRAAEYFAAKNSGELVDPSDVSTAELVSLQKKTAAARAFFGDDQVGRNWRASFEIDPLAEDVERLLKASTTFVPTRVQTASQRRDDANFKTAAVFEKFAETFDQGGEAKRALLTRYLRDRLNSVCYKIEKTPMTPEQRGVFRNEPLDRWVAAVSAHSCDQTDGLRLLLDFERYEGSGGGDDGSTLQQNARRMTTSRSDVCRKFGAAFDVVYDNPNVKAYISEALINRLLPIRDPEFDVVQETVLNNPVAGRRRTDAQVFIKLTPDPSRLLMNLNVQGRVVAETKSTIFPATLHNESYATYLGQKTLEWRDFGLAYSPTTVASDSVNKLSSVQTDVDFVPLVGDLAREVVRSQYESKRAAIRQETRARVAREVRARIDGEANERFDAVNKRLRENFFADLARLDLSLKTQRSKTTDEWLLASLRFGSDFSLGCQSTEPPTLPGAFADFKIHESALNAALARLELGGKTGTPRQALDYLAEKLNKPALKKIEIDENELVFSFAQTDPVVVRFCEGRVQLRLRFAELALGDSSWNDVEVVVSYRPQTAPDGSATFVRDGVVELDGPLNIRAQIPLRAIFSKIFPAEKSFDLQPKIFETDERFAGLALGLCRVSRGWFAISVVCP